MGVTLKQGAVATPDGIYDVYEHDGKEVMRTLRTPSAALTSAIAAQEAARAAEANKRQVALTVIRNQVARVKAIPDGSRTAQDRWLLALSFLALTEE